SSGPFVPRREEPLAVIEDRDQADRSPLVADFLHLLAATPYPQLRIITSLSPLSARSVVSGGVGDAERRRSGSKEQRVEKLPRVNADPRARPLHGDQDPHTGK